MKIFQHLENMVIIATEQFGQKKEIFILREMCSSYIKERLAICIKQLDISLEYFPNLLYLKIKQTECLIRLIQLDSASANTQKLEASNILLKSLLYYYNEDYAEAIENLIDYNNYNKDEAGERLIEICKILHNAKIIISENYKEQELEKLRAEFEKCPSHKWESDIRRRLHLQRALFKDMLAEKKGGFKDCVLSLAIEEDKKIRKSSVTNGKEDDTATISLAKSAENLCNQDSTLKIIHINKNM